MSPETTTVLGRRAEDSALDYLRAHGLELLTRNYRCRGGEIDLVMRELEQQFPESNEGQDVLVLVEVRSRTSSGYGSAAATVDGRKQSRIVHAARHLLRMRPELGRLKARFDVVALEPGADGSSGVEAGAVDATRAPSAVSRRSGFAVSPMKRMLLWSIGLFISR